MECRYKPQADLLTKIFPEAQQPGEEAELDPARQVSFDSQLSIGTVDAAQVVQLLLPLHRLLVRPRRLRCLLIHLLIHLLLHTLNEGHHKPMTPHHLLKCLCRQGTEAAVVLLSCVRSNAQAVLGFTAQWQRVNVALSRAQCELHVVGSVSTLTEKNDIWHHVHHHIVKHGEVVKHQPIPEHAASNTTASAEPDLEEAQYTAHLVQSQLARARSRVASTTGRLERSLLAAGSFKELSCLAESDRWALTAAAIERSVETVQLQAA